MAHLRHDCPHCFTKMAAFTSFGEHGHVSDKRGVTAAFFCSICDKGIFLDARSGGVTIHNNAGDVRRIGDVTIRSIYPTGSETSVPQHLPDNIASFYKQAAESLKAGHYDASGTMSRKSLDVATKILNPEGKGSLKKRIEKLADNGFITSDLKDWAHIIRDDGNDAAHEIVPTTKESAEELLSFAEMFLMYTFTMPQMVKDKRGDVLDEEAEGGDVAA